MPAEGVMCQSLALFPHEQQFIIFSFMICKTQFGQLSFFLFIFLKDAFFPTEMMNSAPLV